MLQRLVRSIVSTAPRPCLIDEVPWLCSVSVTARKSRPGKSDSMRVQERRVDRQRVGEGAVHRAGLLDDDLAVALEDVGLDLADVPWISDSTDCSPERMRARVSRTQVGQSESVVRGQPSCGLERSRLFKSGAGDHLGWNDLASTRRLTRLKHRPGDPGAPDERPLDRLPHVHVRLLCRRGVPCVGRLRQGLHDRRSDRARPRI